MHLNSRLFIKSWSDDIMLVSLFKSVNMLKFVHLYIFKFGVQLTIILLDMISQLPKLWVKYLYRIF